MLNLANGKSGTSVRFDVLVQNQRWFYNSAAVLAVLVDLLLAINVRPRRLVCYTVLTIALAGGLLFVPYGNASGAELAVVLWNSAFLGLNLTIYCMEAFRGPFDTFMDPFCSCRLPCDEPQSAEQIGSASSTTTTSRLNVGREAVRISPTVSSVAGASHNLPSEAASSSDVITTPLPAAEAAATERTGNRDSSFTHNAREVIAGDTLRRRLSQEDSGRSRR